MSAGDQTILTAGDRRLRRFHISPEILLMLIRGVVPDSSGRCQLSHATNLPEDVEIIHVDWDFMSKSATVLCKSKTFEPTPDNQLYIDYFPIMMQTQTYIVNPVL